MWIVPHGTRAAVGDNPFSNMIRVIAARRGLSIHEAFSRIISRAIVSS